MLSQGKDDFSQNQDELLTELKKKDIKINL